MHSHRSTETRQRRQAVSRPIGSYLWALIICSVLPLLAFQAYTVTRSAQAEIRLAEAQAERITHALGDVMDRELASLEAGLAVLADTHTDGGDLAAFARAAREFAGHYHVRIELIDRNGHAVLDTGAVPGAPARRTAHPQEVDRVLDRRQPQVLDAYAGAGSLMHAGLLVPVSRDGAALYALQASWPLPGLGAALNRAQIPSTWPATVVDSRGVRLWRSSHPELIGKRLSPSFFKRLMEAKDGRTESTSATDEIPVLNFSSSLTRANWTAIVAVPQSELRAPFYRAVALMSGAGALALLFSLAMAGWISRRVGDEVRATAAQAEQLSDAGEPA
ncbi:MAG TPA: hypothetical protein VIT92_13700, partial [Burkholderiaceae bacterium]